MKKKFLIFFKPKNDRELLELALSDRNHTKLQVEPVILRYSFPKLVKGVLGKILFCWVVFPPYSPQAFNWERETSGFRFQILESSKSEI